MGVYLVQPAAGIAVRHHLDGGVHALGQVRARGDLDGAHAEVVGAALAEGRAQHDVVGRARVVADGQQHLQVRLGVAELQLDGRAGQREGGAVARDGVEAAAREGAGLVVVEAAGGGPFEREVRGGEGQGREAEGEEGGGEHCCGFRCRGG